MYLPSADSKIADLPLELLFLVIPKVLQCTFFLKIKNVEQNKKTLKNVKKRGKNKKRFFTSLNHTIINVAK